MTNAPTHRLVAIVTGASTGIGADIARVMARAGHDLALVARDGDRLNRLADELAAVGRPRPMVIQLDLSLPGAADTLMAALREAGASAKFLINNAGFGLAGEASKLDRAAQMTMIDVNVRALVDLTLATLPMLIENRGRILNCASTAAFMPGPGFTIYYATKAFVLSFSEAMSQELSGQGVTVTALCPGPTQSEFQRRAGFDPGAALSKMPMMPSMVVAKAGYDAMMAGKRVAVPGLGNKVMVLAAAFAPHAILLPVVARIQGMRGKSA